MIRYYLVHIDHMEPVGQLTYAADRQADIVDKQAIHPRLVGDVSQYDTSNSIGHADRRDQVAGVLLVNAQLLGMIGDIQIWQVEADAGAEVRDCEDQKDHIPQQREVHHFGERVARLRGAADAAAAFC